MKQSNRIRLILAGLLSIFAISLWLSGNSLPSSPHLYNLKRLQEKIFMAVKSNPQDRVGYYHALLDMRLNELKSMVENRQFAFILTSSLRYSTTAGQMVQIIIDHRLEEEASSAQKTFLLHQNIIRQLDDNYPKDENNEWKFVQDDYNYLTIYSQQLMDVFGNEIQTK